MTFKETLCFRLSNDTELIDCLLKVQKVLGQNLPEHKLRRQTLYLPPDYRINDENFLSKSLQCKAGFRLCDLSGRFI